MSPLLAAIAPIWAITQAVPQMPSHEALVVSRAGMLLAVGVQLYNTICGTVLSVVSVHQVCNVHDDMINADACD